MSKTPFDLIGTQFERLRAVEDHLANGSRYADDDECHPLYPHAVAARQILEREIARLSALAADSAGLSNEQVRELLESEAAHHAVKRKNSNGIRGWAAAHGVRDSRACEVLSGKRAPNDEVLAALGLERRIVRTAGRGSMERETA